MMISCAAPTYLSGVLGRFRLLVRPDTVLRWHRDLMARRHAARSCLGRPGRPRTVRSIRQLVLRLAEENPCWVTAASTANSGGVPRHGRDAVRIEDASLPVKLILDLRHLRHLHSGRGEVSGTFHCSRSTITLPYKSLTAESFAAVPFENRIRLLTYGLGGVSAEYTSALVRATDEILDTAYPAQARGMTG